MLIEALRLAFVDARWYVADPRTNPAPLEALLSKTFAAQRRRLLDPQAGVVWPRADHRARSRERCAVGRFRPPRRRLGHGLRITLGGNDVPQRPHVPPLCALWVPEEPALFRAFPHPHFP
ncbi:MAG TPA: hypothetical protein G4O04_00360 [Anaerolineae bacterium]|nr:hypothetical protein [Anaerolineae bacterium]